MDNGPITTEVVAEEIFSALEAQGEDGGFEIGVYKIRVSKKNPSRLVLTLMKDSGKAQRFYLKITAAK